MEPIDPSHGGLSKLLPKAIVAKRRRRKRRQQQEGHDQADQSNRDSRSSLYFEDGDGDQGSDYTDGDISSMDKRHSCISRADQSGSNNVHPNDPNSNSAASVRADHDSPASPPAPASSFVSASTSASPQIAPQPQPPSPFKYRPETISTHPSQIGYLTTSSPIIQATHIPEPQGLDQTVPDLASRSSTAPLSKRTESVESDFRSSLSARSKTGLGLQPPQKDTKRSPSPVGKKLANVFRSKKSNLSLAGGAASPGGSANPSPSTSPEGKPASLAEDDDKNRSLPNLSSLSNSQSQSDLSNTTEPDADSIATTASAASSRPNDRKSRSRASTLSNRISIVVPAPTTPPNEKTGPIIVNTPPTPTDPNQIGPHSPPPTKQSADASNGPTPWGNLITHRRSRSGSAEPFSHNNVELESSMLSAAQNAANQFSNTLQNNNIGQTPPKSSNLTANQTDLPEEDQVQVEPPLSPSRDANMDKEPAVKTLGDGELTLNQLGIVDPPSISGTPMTAKFPESVRSETRARSESAPAADTSSAASHEYGSDDARPAQNNAPRSLYENGGLGDRTPPPASLYEDKSAITRSGSVRSALGRRRHRGSSTATRGTGTTIGAAIAAANSSLGNPAANISQQRLTGFAVSSKKRNRDFHALFKSVPDDDYLIEDYSCALQREILAHGRLYVSEGHLCFSSNILGWSTTLVMSFDEIVSVEKRSTALVFKNGLMISTLHAKHIFASFTSRDSTYDLIVNIWKLGHPTLRSSLNGVQLEGTGGDKTEKVDVGDEGSQIEGAHDQLDDQSMSGSDDESEDGDDIYDEDDEEDMVEPSQPQEPGAESDHDKVVGRKASGATALNGAPSDLVNAVGPPIPADDFPGPATHAPTECGDAASHYEKIVGDDIVPAPLGKVYDLLFGPASVTFMSKWLVNEAKCWDLQMEDRKGLSSDNMTRTYSYMKPLGGSIGPSKTKCIVSESIDHIDLEKAVNITCSTQTPDVPSGNAFIVKTKYCLSWAENNSTRVQVNCTLEWTGKSWLKGPITSGANEGQTTYVSDLLASTKAAVSSRPRSGTGNTGSGKKKKGRKNRNLQSGAGGEDKSHAKSAPPETWGMLEPLRPILGPITDLLKPLMTGNVTYGLLVGLLVAAWFGFPGQGARRQVGFYGYPDRVAAYEEMWRREETELWDWLEERVGLERLNDGSMPTRKRAIEPRTVEEKIREERMDEREIQEAIRVTEEKLQVLKGVVGKQRTGEEIPLEDKKR
ncbi:putative membrane protein C20F10.07 like [Verticillium longisporum]|uniref:Putative membrane protein C20F10.07 like n=1 Tax=Verticillium longisporum TaxID=100787 RepID=A0A8I3AHZ8_VERLO|nr:putative membrane protein C20F10.07 like [Verticillium longisporum]